MSSKLYRGGCVRAQSIVWRSTAPDDTTASRGAAFQAPVCQESTFQPERAESAIRTVALDGEIDLRVAEARQAGWLQGHAAALEENAAVHNQLVERLARSVEEVSGLKQRLRREAERELVELSLAIARRILHREMTVDPEALHGIVVAALSRLDQREISEVRVHPEQAPFIQACLAAMGLPQRIEVLPDRSLERGGLILKTGRGNIDASVETQLAEISRGLSDFARQHEC